MCVTYAFSFTFVEKFLFQGSFQIFREGYSRSFISNAEFWKIRLLIASQVASGVIYCFRYDMKEYDMKG